MSNKEKTNGTVSKKVEEQRFEFVLYINNNIICQRFFNIFDYNEDFVKSEELKEMMDDIAGVNSGRLGIIPNYLKKQSINYLWENYNPYFLQTDELYKSPSKKGDVFKFEFKVDKNVVAASEFDNNYFTLNPKVSVDIREVIPDIMSEIRQATSRKSYVIDRNTKAWEKSQKDFLVK
jgi:hypothetical protein